MSRIDTLVCTLPAHWADSLINDDDSAYDPAELRAMRQFVGSLETYRAFPIPVATSDEQFFSHRHDAWQFWPYAADCLEFTFHIHHDKEH